MNAKEAFDLTARLIQFKSVTGNEREVLDFLSTYFTDKSWSVEKVLGDDQRYSILVTFGEPKIVFTSHVDVVPAEECQFIPEVKGNLLYGRGACDAKGIVATMIAALDNLEQQGETDFALLIVFEEETTGFGAKQAAKELQGRGIKYLVNGEPTEGTLALGHKGVVVFEANFTGTKAHSGYPELGEDANRKMHQAMSRLYDYDFGKDPELGPATINIGLVSGGTATNIISDRASFQGMIRSVGDYKEVQSEVLNLISELAEVEFISSKNPVKLLNLPGFENLVAKYFTDIPNFAPLAAQALMYGPGAISRAHTDSEYISLEEIETGISDYQKIFMALKNK